MAFASTLKQCVSHAVWANKEGSERERPIPRADHGLLRHQPVNQHNRAVKR